MKTAVVLAAGPGLRAWPYCGIRQKVTIPVLNTPMVRRLVVDLLALGVEDAVVVTGCRGEAVRACLGDLDGVRFVHQTAPKGPVDAALTGLAPVSSEHVLIAHGDIVTARESLQAVMAPVDEGRCAAAALTAPTPAGASSWISVLCGGAGLIEGVWGQGDRRHPRFAGVLAGNTDRLRRHLERNPGLMVNVDVGAMPPMEGELAYTLQQCVDEGGEALAVSAEGFFVDVDKPWDILEANRAASEHAFASIEGIRLAEGAAIDDGAHIDGEFPITLGAGARIGAGCYVRGPVMLGAGAEASRGAILGANAVIGPNARCTDCARIGDHSVMGSGCIAGHCAEFSGVAFDGAYLCHYGSVTGVVGTHVDIGAGTVCGTWRFDNSVKTQNVRGHKERPERFGSCVYIGDYTRTGVNAALMPGVKVGCYSCVGAGAVVYDDVPERTLLLVQQEHVHKPWGPGKYGW